MRKRTRMFIVVLVLAILGWFLVPTLRWYSSSEETRNEAAYTINEIKNQAKKFAETGYQLFDDQYQEDPEAELNLLKASEDDLEDQIRFEAFNALNDYVVLQYKDASAKLPDTMTYSQVRGIFVDYSDTTSLEELSRISKEKIITELIDHKRAYYFDLKDNSEKIIQLGLDLNGGVSYTLQADLDDYVKGKNKQSLEAAYQQAQEDGEIAEEDLDKDPSELDLSYDKISLLNSGEIDRVMEIAVEQVTERVNIYGTTEPQIQRLGRDLIQVDLPGAKDPQRLERLLMGRGALNFHVLNNDLTAQVNQWIIENKEDPLVIAAEDRFSKEYVLELPESANIPAEYMVVGLYEKDDYREDEFQQYVVVEREPGMPGSRVVGASVTKGNNTQVATAFRLDSQGAELFGEMTDGADVNPVSIAVLMDNKVKMNATANKKLATTTLNVSGGGINEEEAWDLAKLLNLGSKDVNVEIISNDIVGASLGKDNVSDGIFALGVALALVIGFMLIWYLGGGLAAVIALLMNIFIMAGILSQVNLTLTLAGLAGLILTVGMSVDANVIIFERIKEEARLGKSAASALRSGFQKAFWTILDANITTFIAAVVLSWFGSGTVKGFAVILAVGIFSSMFTALFVVRLFLDMGVETFRAKRLLISWRK